MKDITRRLFMRHAAASSAVAVTVAAPSLAEALPAHQHPIERLHQLHDEASELMAVHNEQFGGEWELRIRAPYDQTPVIYSNLHSQTPMKRLEAAQAELIAAAKAAYPQVDDWRTVPNDNLNEGLPFMFLIVGHNRAGKAKMRKAGA